MIVELCIMIVGTLRRLFASYLMPHTDLTDLTDLTENFFGHKTNLWDLCEPIGSWEV